MGIRWFHSFLNSYPTSLLESVSVSDQYILIDGSEILYELYNDAVPDGRADYVEFREHIIKFFKNLEDCNIKPIVISDGFKFEKSAEIYIDRRRDKIALMQQTISGSHHSPIDKRTKGMEKKGYMCSLVLKQTAQEMKVPWFVAQRNTDEDLAGLSKLLKAPVLASDTIFCAYRLEAGFIPINTFSWKTPRNIHGSMAIQAKKYQIHDFSTRFRITPEALGFLAVVFPQQNFERFEKFRDRYFKRVRLPAHLKGIHDRRFRRPNLIENGLVWFSNCTNKTTEEIVELVLAASGESQTHEIRQEIMDDIERYEDPKLRKSLLHVILETIEDPECQAKLETGLDESICDENIFFPFNDADFQKTYNSGGFPSWAVRLLLSYTSGRQLITFLPLVLTDQLAHESPHAALFSIRELCYQILFRKVQNEDLSIVEYDRVELEYVAKTIQVSPFCDEIGIDSSEESSVSCERNRRLLIWNALVNQGKEQARGIEEVENFENNMKLVLAATIYWKTNFSPNQAMVTAVTFLLVLMEIKQRNNTMTAAVNEILKSIRKKSEEKEFNLDCLQHTSQWEICLSAAINLNVLLHHPFTEPAVGKFFSAVWLEIFYEIICSGTNVEEILATLCGASELFHNVDLIVGQ